MHAQLCGLSLKNLVGGNTPALKPSKFPEMRSFTPAFQRNPRTFDALLTDCEQPGEQPVNYRGRTCAQLIFTTDSQSCSQTYSQGFALWNAHGYNGEHSCTSYSHPLRIRSFIWKMDSLIQELGTSASQSQNFPLGSFSTLKSVSRVSSFPKFALLLQIPLHLPVSLLQNQPFPDNLRPAGVVQWQNTSFPSLIRGFDSLHPLHLLFSRKSPGIGPETSDLITGFRLYPTVSPCFHCITVRDCAGSGGNGWKLQPDFPEGRAGN
ncbi:MAG: hypothetical protein JWM59_1301 [Verrucomicrobiales bacterium]|nr:hypothetical protein [Verrucomicrobiales bacterium]